MEGGLQLRHKSERALGNFLEVFCFSKNTSVELKQVNKGWHLLGHPMGCARQLSRCTHNSPSVCTCSPPPAVSCDLLLLLCPSGPSCALPCAVRDGYAGEGGAERWVLTCRASQPRDL